MTKQGMWAYIRKPAELPGLFKELANILQSFVNLLSVIRVSCIFVYSVLFIIRPRSLPLKKPDQPKQTTEQQEPATGTEGTVQTRASKRRMAIAMVSTPDVAKDLFSGLWDQNTERDLYQAYQNLTTTTKSENFQPTITYRDSRPASSCSMQGAQTSYIPVTTSYIPVTCAPSTSYIPVASTGPAYIPTACPTPPTSYITTSNATQYSPLSCGSSSCSESSKTESFDSSSSFTGGPGPSSTRECTKLALILLAQSSKKKLSREEEEKRRIRRERNKIAATKCRQKRRAHSNNVGNEYGQVIARQKELEDQIGALQREKEELKQLLDTHYCHKPITPGYIPHSAPSTSFAELFVKQEPETPILKQELDPFN